MKYTRAWLTNHIIENTIDFLFFFGHQPSKDGTITQSCLSQWWIQPFQDNEGTNYTSAEQYMMAGKARVFGDNEVLAEILASDNPADVKKLGRKVANFDDKTWQNHKYEIVKQGNIFKFSQNEDLKTFLLATHTKILVEASPYDTIWGIGLGKEHVNAPNPALWRGQNLLGFALMEVREALSL
jgi:ribA/ribD-fused uncharacterized protein